MEYAGEDYSASSLNKALSAQYYSVQSNFVSNFAI